VFYFVNTIFLLKIDYNTKDSFNKRGILYFITYSL